MIMPVTESDPQNRTGICSFNASDQSAQALKRQQTCAVIDDSGFSLSKTAFISITCALVTNNMLCKYRLFQHLALHFSLPISFAWCYPGPVAENVVPPNWSAGTNGPAIDGALVN